MVEEGAVVWSPETVPASFGSSPPPPDVRRKAGASDGSSGAAVFPASVAVVSQRSEGSRPPIPVVLSGRMFGGLDEIPIDPEVDPPRWSVFQLL